MTTSETCLACRLTTGDEPLPGGRIWATDHWVVEHCIGPLLQCVARVVQELTQADQVYTCLWSHANWQPVHIHFVVQPVRHELRQTYPKQGPALQAAMLQDGPLPDPEAVEAFCREARQRLGLSS